MIRMVEREKSILVELASLLELTPSNGNEPDFIIQDLLTQFLDVFQKPYGLLSMRSRDHSIILKGEAAPVNVWLYRYLFIQKKVIDELVQEMFKACIIDQALAHSRAKYYECGRRRMGCNFVGITAH